MGIFRKHLLGSGFTLVELMIVIAIVGLLSTTAIPTFGKFVRKSRAVEAYVAIDHIEKAQLVFYAENKYFTFGGSGPLSNLGPVRNARTYEYNPDYSMPIATATDPQQYFSTYESLSHPIPMGSQLRFYYRTYAGNYDPTGARFTSYGSNPGIGVSGISDGGTGSTGCVVFGGGGTSLNASDFGVETSPTTSYHWTITVAQANLSDFNISMRDDECSTIVKVMDFDGTQASKSPFITFSMSE